MRRAGALLAALLAAALLWTGAAALGSESPAAELETGIGAVQGGQEVELLLSLSDCFGVNAAKGTLAYDPAVFAPPAQEDFEGLNGWESVVYNPDNGQFALIHRADDPGAGAVLRITLTAREEPAAGETRVAVAGLSLSGGEEDVFPGEVEVTLHALSGERPADPDQGGQESQSQPGPTPGADGDQSQPEPTPGADGDQSQSEPTPGADGDQSQPEPTPGADGDQPQPEPAPGADGDQSQPELTPDTDADQV